MWGLHVVLKENRTGEAIFKDSNPAEDIMVDQSVY